MWIRRLGIHKYMSRTFYNFYCIGTLLRYFFLTRFQLHQIEHILTWDFTLASIHCTLRIPVALKQNIFCSVFKQINDIAK